MILPPNQKHGWPVQITLPYGELHPSYGTFLFILLLPKDMAFILHNTLKTFTFITIHHDHRPHTQQISKTFRTSSPGCRRVQIYRWGGFTDANIGHETLIWIRGENKQPEKRNLDYNTYIGTQIQSFSEHVHNNYSPNDVQTNVEGRGLNFFTRFRSKVAQSCYPRSTCLYRRV